MDNNQKIENLLHLALEATEREREESLDLDTGYDPATRRWDLIVRYTGDVGALGREGVVITPLLGKYAIVSIEQDQIETFAAQESVVYVEKPKRLFFAANRGRTASCIAPLQLDDTGLYGSGIIVAVIDSGIDYAHPDFCNADGTTRILRLWDQSAAGTPPQGYALGAEFTQEQINAALEVTIPSERYSLIPSRDLSGHGTEVAGIAAGNGMGSGGVYRGVASASELVIVKLGIPGENTFPRTTELMQAVDYVIRLGLQWNRPVAINLSFGNSYGSHRGDSLLETYLDEAAALGRTTICVGMGNEGISRTHRRVEINPIGTTEIELPVGSYEATVNVQLWKSYVDRFHIELLSPAGESAGIISEGQMAQRLLFEETEVLFYFGEPAPYSVRQEIYLDFIPRENYVSEGIWLFRIYPEKILDGAAEMWLPGGGVLGDDTFFYRSTQEGSLTIPASASQVIAVGAYDTALDAYADFSGRGFAPTPEQVRPDLAAPGVNIRTTKTGGGYTFATGTSFATPFVTGSTALLMEWGIVRGFDPYLYGEKVKAYLRRGARQLPGYRTWPNNQVGWGALCVQNSLPE